jgi:tetratricopeptide (TPR) repeat protein
MSSDMPWRPSQHDLETASARAFETALPDQWDAQRRGGTVEYGIDYDVEIFAEGQATALRFPVQLKGVETLRGRPPSRSIRWSTWNYWMAHDAPVLVVLWERETGTLWWKWAHHFDTYGLDRSNRTFTFKFDADRTWTETTDAEIEEEVRAWRAWQAARGQLPLSVIIRSDGHVQGVPANMVAADVRLLLSGLTAFLQVRRRPIGELYLTLEIGTNETVARASGGPSGTLHYGAAEPLSDRDAARALSGTIAADFVFLFAVHLSRFHLDYEAARLAGITARKGTIVFDPPTAYTTIDVLVKGGLLNVAVDLLVRLLNPLTDAAAGAIRRLLELSESLDSAEHRHISDRLLELAETVNGADGDAESPGKLTYNAARFISRSDHQRAVALYDLAAEREPAYKQREYWWRERSGLMFLLGDYEAAASGYRTAIELGDERSGPLLADALLFAGQYRRALEMFNAAGAGNETGRDAEWGLKRRVLEYLMNTFQIEEQVRQPDVAASIADTSDDDGGLRRALDADLLCGHALFKLALIAVDEGRPSLDHFLAWAVAEPSHPLAWLDALVHAMEEEPAAVEGIAVTARRLAGTAIIDMVMTDEEAFGEELASAIEDLFEELPPEADEPMELRFVGDEPGQIETYDLTSARIDGGSAG